MRSSLKLAFILNLSGCLGPLLPLPQTAHTPHAWACAFLACPAAADRIGGLVIGSKYDRALLVCECELEDSRHLPAFVTVNPHSR